GHPGGHPGLLPAHRPLRPGGQRRGIHPRLRDRLVGGVLRRPRTDAGAVPEMAIPGRSDRMSLDNYRLQVRPGPGLIARTPGGVLLIGDGPHARGPVADAVIAAFRGPGDYAPMGGALLDAVRAALAPGAAGVPDLCLLVPTGDDLTVLLRGD